MTGISLADFTASSGFDVEEVDRLLSRYGAAVIPGWVKEPLLSQLQHDWDAVRSERTDPSSRRIARLGGATVDYAGLYRSTPGGKAFPAIEQVFNSPQMTEICDRFIGKPCLFNEEIYMTFDVGRSEEVAPSHFDKTYNIKFFIYLHDILQSGRGAFSVHPGSQTIARRQFREWFDRKGDGRSVRIGTDAYYEMGNETLPQDLGPCIEILAPAGTLIVFSTDVFHRGGILEKGYERRVVRGHCCPGYMLPRAGDVIRKGSRQWMRGENWEVNRRRYSPLSADGFLEWRDFVWHNWDRAKFGRSGRLFGLSTLLANYEFLLKPSFYKRIALKLFGTR